MRLVMSSHLWNPKMIENVVLGRTMLDTWQGCTAGLCRKVEKAQPRGCHDWLKLSSSEWQRWHQVDSSKFPMPRADVARQSYWGRNTVCPTMTSYRQPNWSQTTVARRRCAYMRMGKCKRCTTIAYCCIQPRKTCVPFLNLPFAER